MISSSEKRFVYEFGDFILDPFERTLYAAGTPIRLPAKEFDTLLLLVEHNGRALSKEEMISAIWQDSFVEEGNLAKQISKLRKLLNSGGNGLIETIPKHGYKLRVADLRMREPDQLEPIVIEKKTIRRIRISTNGEGIETRPLLSPQARRRRIWPVVLPLTLFFLFGTGSLAWYLYPRKAAAVDPYEPVRLTDHPMHDTGPYWTRDGRIRFTRIYSDQRAESWIMMADGSAQAAVPMPAGIRIFSWSPDERKILFQKGDDRTKTYLANADGTDEKVLPFRGGNWSADSTMLTARMHVGGQNHDIFVYRVETGELWNVTNSPDFDADPSFSPDGSNVLFGSGRDGNSEIYSVKVDGTGLRRLTFDPAIDAHAAYSPDGTQILFNSTREHENGDVYLMNADGSQPVKVTEWKNSNETAGPGSWSPDGTKIAFFSDREGKDDIYVVNAETSRPRLVYSEPEHDLGTPAFSPDGSRIAYSRELGDRSGELRILDRRSGRSSLIRKTEVSSAHPQWSPDGERIAFHDRLDGSSEICLIGPDGQGFLSLTSDPARDTGPAWSPDGSRLVFTSARGDPPNMPQIYSMLSDGSEQRPITSQKGWEGEPVWAPDGRSIIFTCDRNDSRGDLLDICSMDPDGSNERRILSHRDHDSNASVSPDGRRIAFVALSDGNSEIYMVNFDGSGFVRLTRNQAEERSPEWSADGRSLIFVSNRGGKFAIYEIDVW